MFQAVSPDRLRGLYVITDHALTPDKEFEKRIGAAMDGGASIIQYRDKSTDQTRRRQQARQLRLLCDRKDALLIINDDPVLAQAANADGVHLGKDDPALGKVRDQLGPDAIIGVSCYNDLDAAKRAQDQGASYVAFGRFFSSPTKPDAAPATLDTLIQAKQELTIPVCAIGGITVENSPALIEAGADMLAVISGVFGARYIRAAARDYSNLFHN